MRHIVLLMVYILVSSGVFDGKDIARLIKSTAFAGLLQGEEVYAWNCIKEIIKNLLGKSRAGNSSLIVERMMLAFQRLDVHMSLKIHYLHSHLDAFWDQMSTESDEHGERFHQTAAVMECRYKSKRLDSMMGDLCWWIDKSFDHDTEENTNLSDINPEDTESEEEISDGANECCRGIEHVNRC